ncbi:hypothetical protein K438DRAFT_1966892 [Mycena galopus ATCC 62051]|nr:hypothetical protein K438DRAFT_1966892 [Mycena galopus ATCC 62051]
MFFFTSATPLPALERLEIRASTVLSPLHTMLSSIVTVVLALRERGPQRTRMRVASTPGSPQENSKHSSTRSIGPMRRNRFTD